MEGEALADDLQAWASRELRLVRVPPRAVLSALCGPPRARAIFRELVDRARAPDHVAEAHAAAALRPREDDDPVALERASKELEELTQDALALEKEVVGLRSRASRGPARRARCARHTAGNEAVREFKAAFADTMSQQCVDVSESVDAIDRILEPVGVPPQGVEDVEKELERVLSAVTSPVSREEYGTIAEEAFSRVEALSKTVGAVEVLQVLTEAAEREFRTDRETEKEATWGEKNEEVDWIAELKRRQMEEFLEVEELCTLAREAETEVEAQLQEASSQNVASLAKLAGERVAIAESEKIERSVRMCTNPEATKQRKEIEDARVIVSRTASATAALETQSAGIDRLARQNERVLRSVTALSREFSEYLRGSVVDVCRKWDEASVSHTESTRDSLRRLCLLEFESHARVSAGEKSYRFAGDSYFGEAGDGLDDGADPVRVAVAQTAEDVENMHYSNSCKDLVASRTSFASLRSQMNLVHDVFKRDQSAHEADLSCRLQASAATMRDCIERLVPAAHLELRLLRDQPGKEVVEYCIRSTQESA